MDQLSIDRKIFYRGLIAAVLVLAAAGLGSRWWRQRAEVRFDPYILAASERYHIDPALVKAVIWRESRFRPMAHGGAGEIGLMQVNRLAAQEWAEASNLKFFRHRELY